MKPAKRAVLVALALVAVGLLVLLVLSGRQTSVRLADGSTLTLVGLTQGTNAFIQGSVLERLLGGRLPPHGLSLFDQSLRRPRQYPPDSQPDDHAPLTAWFELRDLPVGWQDFPGGLAAWKVFATSPDGGRQFQNPAGSVSSLSSRKILWGTPITAFPRNGQEFRLRLQPGIKQGQASPVVEFRIPNPSPVTPRRLRAASPPQTNQLDGLAVVLTRARAESPSGRGGARLDIQLQPPAGQGLDWGIKTGTIEDEEGNRRVAEETGLNAIGFDTRLSLPADQPWQVAVTLIRGRNFTPAELTALSFAATNAIFVTNASGQVFHCRFDGQSLEVESADWATATQRPALQILAIDAENKELPPGRMHWHGTISRFQSVRWINRSLPPRFRLYMVTPKELRTEFVVMPEGK